MVSSSEPTAQRPLATDAPSRTIEQPTEHKLEIIDDTLIVTGTGYVGHQQRFCEVVRKLWNDKKLSGASAIEDAKLLAQAGIHEFGQTIHIPNLPTGIQCTALVAYPAGGQPCLCELPGPLGFQPEVKQPDDLWFVSAGSGQPITDPFLAMLREVFWHDGPPTTDCSQSRAPEPRDVEDELPAMNARRRVEDPISVRTSVAFIAW